MTNNYEKYKNSSNEYYVLFLMFRPVIQKN